MSHKKFLSVKEIALAAVVGSLLLVFALVGYTQAQASILLAQVSVEDQKNQANEIKNKQNYLKSLRTEVNQIKKDVKTGIDATAVEALLSQFEVCFTKMSSQVGSDHFWGDMQECDGYSQDANNELQDNLRPKRDCANNKKNIDNRKRERKDLNRNVKDILRNDKEADVSQLNALLAKIDALLVTADGISPATCDRDGSSALNDVQNEMSGFFQDFYGLSGDINTVANEKRNSVEGKKDFENNLKKGCEKDKKREFTNYSKEFERATKNGTVTPEQQEAFNGVKAAYEKLCVELIGSMQSALDAGDFNAFNDSRNEFWSSDRDFFDTLNTARGAVQEKQQQAEETKNKARETQNVMRDLANQEKDAKRMQKQIVRLKKLYDKAVKKFASRDERKELLAEFGNLVTQAETLVSNIQASVDAAKTEAADDPQSYWMDRGDELNELRNEFNDVQNRVSAIADVMSQMKNVERELKNREREIKRYEKDEAASELVVRLKEIVSGARTSIQEVWNALATEPEDARNIMQSIWDFNNDFNDEIRDWEENRQDYFDDIKDNFEGSATQGL